MKRIESFKSYNEKRGLWDNVHDKKKRGEAPAKPGDEDYPKADAWKDAQESVVTEEDTLAELNAMTLGQLERIADYANMITDRMRGGQQLDSWMFSQITVALDNLNAVHDTMDGVDGVKEWVKKKAYEENKRDGFKNIKEVNEAFVNEAKFTNYSNNELMGYIKELSKQRADAASKGQTTLLNSIHKDIEKAQKELDKRSKKLKSLSRTDEAIINEGITSETDKVANEFKKELIDMKKHFGSRLKDNTIYWSGYKRVMKASEGSEGLEPSKDGIIPMYLYWMSKYRADKSGKYTKLAMEIEKKGIKLQPMSDQRDGTDNWKITIS